ncbi:hypothetical protein HRbin02_01760 [Candidatus Calditenuaceae archaeon HR02]|nr:hypothetical protein HRbin02_01760 [Candidatus Calditenuaceae archaeon HR02]
MKGLGLTLEKPVGIGFTVGQFGKGIEHRATNMSSSVLFIVQEEFVGKAEEVLTSMEQFQSTAHLLGMWL